MRIAISKNGIVENIILANSLEEAQALFPEHTVAEADRYTDFSPVRETDVTRMIVQKQINDVALSENDALRMTGYFPAWETGREYPAGYRVRRGGALWTCRQAHTAQEGWEPGETGTESLWAQISITHAGTAEDPIPYSGNMALENGKYYTQNGTLYRCTRDTGNPVSHALAELVEIYVEAAG